MQHDRFSISHGRFGLNLITGWQRPEYSQMGLWPGDEHFRNRYQMLDEYARILRELWETGRSDFKGEYYQMDDCLVRPKPEGDMKIICAGSSDEGLAFSAKWADYAFCLGKGVNTPTAFAFNNERLAEATAKTGRDVSVFVLVMIIAAETDEEAMARWKHINAGVDHRRDRLARQPGRRRQGQRHHQRPPARRARRGGQHQHGDAGRQLCEHRADARRDGRGAEHRRRAADVRRFPRRASRISGRRSSR